VIVITWYEVKRGKVLPADWVVVEAGDEAALGGTFQGADK
jgi:hypothetical protein